MDICSVVMNHRWTPFGSEFLISKTFAVVTLRIEELFEMRFAKDPAIHRSIVSQFENTVAVAALETRFVIHLIHLVNLG